MGLTQVIKRQPVWLLGACTTVLFMLVAWLGEKLYDQIQENARENAVLKSEIEELHARVKNLDDDFDRYLFGFVPKGK